jgi:thiol-disulfide isomerase/thioredoxin
MKKLKTAAGIVCLCLLASELIGADVRPVADRVRSPDFILKSLDGKEVKLSGLKGKVVLLDFWAVWCPPCRMSIPHLVELSDKFKGKGVVILGINLDSNPKNVPAFVKQYKMPYPVLLGGNSPVQEQYGIDSIPSFILLDKSLRVADANRGFAPELAAVWEEQINILLKERP